MGFEEVALTLSNSNKSVLSPDSVINLDQGDPTLFEPYWRKQGDKCTVVISGNDLMSYFGDVRNVCWFLLPELAESIKRVHRAVGNAVTDDYHIVVGTGATQLFQASLYALCCSAGPEPVSVVCAAPYYSSYANETNLVKSRMYNWEGNAYEFEKEGAYIELVTSPNNPDGLIRQAVVNRPNGNVVHDLAYYWPQFTPITHALNHDIMLFTLSKCTGHAGSRLGWALVKDKEVARKMIKYIEGSSIGVSKESQLRGSKILGVVADECENAEFSSSNFFVHSKKIMAARWERLKEVLKGSERFNLPKYPQEHCNFSGLFTEANPAFAWLKMKEENGEEIDLEGIFKKEKIMTRGGSVCGVGKNYTRISMLHCDDVFNLFIERLSSIIVNTKSSKA